MSRRSAGEGTVGSYETAKGGDLWFWKATITRPDGTRAPKMKRGFAKKNDALTAMREALTASDKAGYTDPSKQQLGAFLADWLAGLQVGASTRAGYRRAVRLHIVPSLGTIPLKSLTPAMITKLYRALEDGGRRGHGGELTGEPLSYRSVQGIAVILGAALDEAVEQDLLAKNPARKAKPPSDKQVRAQAPEMHPWTAAQLGQFLAWAEKNSAGFTAWQVLAMTGMRRGELLALRWCDFDPVAGTITIRRSVGVVQDLGVTEGLTKSGKARVVDLDAGTVAALKTWKAGRGSLHLTLAKPGALIFGDLEGGFRHPVRFSALFQETVKRCRRDLGEDAPPVIRLHDLRHTHATILQVSGVAAAASFGESGERTLPAVQRAALEQARSHGSPGTLRDLGCHHPLASDRTMMQPVTLQRIPA